MADTLRELFVESTPESSEYLDLDVLREYIREHLAGTDDHGKTVWRAVFLKIWLQDFIIELEETENS